MNNTEANKALSSKEQNAQDLYGEPKFLKKKRKKEMSEGIENLTWNPSTGYHFKNCTTLYQISIKTVKVKSMVDILPCIGPINLNLLVISTAFLLIVEERENKILGTKRKLPTKRQVRFLELERLIAHRTEEIPIRRLCTIAPIMARASFEDPGQKENILTVPTEGPLFRSEKFAGMPSISAIQAKLLKADYHELIIVTNCFCLYSHKKTVTQAKNPSLVDLQGIVIQESEQTFKVIQANNEVKTIPKAHTIFQISLPLLPPPSRRCSKGEINKGHKSEKDSSSSEVGDSRLLVFKIFGNQFVFRPTDRVNKKFKSKAFSQL
ncbi:hypothetical protein PSTT_02940, partial [Puccinia striiformis]